MAERNLFDKNDEGVYERVGTDIPEGFEKLGAEYAQRPNETAEQAKERQLASYSNVRPVGAVGSAGSYLIGQKTPLSAPTDQAPPATTQAPNQADIFNTLLKDILVKRQGLDLSGLKKKQRKAQLKYLDAGRGVDENLKGLSPAQIGQIQQAQQQAMRPEVLKATADLEKAQEMASNYETMYQNAAKLGQEFIQNMVAPDNVIQSYKHWIEARPDDLKEFLTNNKVNDKTKEAVFKELDWSLMKEAEEPSEMLSVSDAKALGVPYGTTKKQASEMNITPKYVGSGTTFTPTELKKLEAAGLLDADRQTQLDHLFKSDVEEIKTEEEESKENIKNDVLAITGGDGKLDTAKYIQIKESIKLNNPELLSWFVKTWSPQEFINPNDPTAEDLLYQ